MVPHTGLQVGVSGFIYDGYMEMRGLHMIRV